MFTYGKYNKDIQGYTAITVNFMGSCLCQKPCFTVCSEVMNSLYTGPQPLVGLVQFSTFQSTNVVMTLFNYQQSIQRQAASSSYQFNSYYSNLAHTQFNSYYSNLARTQLSTACTERVQLDTCSQRVQLIHVVCHAYHTCGQTIQGKSLLLAAHHFLRSGIREAFTVYGAVPSQFCEIASEHYIGKYCSMSSSSCCFTQNCIKNGLRMPEKSKVSQEDMPLMSSLRVFQYAALAYEYDQPDHFKSGGSGPAL